MITLYDFPLSGNCHKVRLLLSCLRLPWRRHAIDVIERETQADWFSSLNPLRQVPVLQDGDVIIRDSQAILAYLASAYGPSWTSKNPLETGRIQEWLSFASNEIGASLQPARLFYRAGEHTNIAEATVKSLRVLRVLNERLAGQKWLACDRPTIADLACFPYVALSREGRLPLDDFSDVLGWINRICSLDGYITMEGLPASRSSNDPFSTR